MSTRKIAAIIVAAGRGSRAGAGAPKQYRPLSGRPILAWTVDAFLSHPSVSTVRVIIHPDDEARYADATREFAHSSKLAAPAYGGAERQDSVREGLQSLSETEPDLVLIHDAARPFIRHDVISRVIEALDDADGAIAALPVFDTLKRATDDNASPTIVETVPREAMWRAQTPQGFHFRSILDAHDKAKGVALTDDAAVAEHAGMTVALALGSPDNMKITQAEDFGMAERLLEHRSGSAPLAHRAFETRSGMGFDVHAFTAGDFVTLCGVEIPHTHALLGHSDADAGMHALTDAILGAIGEGDIGTHFPPSEPQWKGAPSRIFLEKARDLVAEAGGAISNVDVTLICERPKIGPHRPAMQAVLAEILQVDLKRVSIKATTTEKLGFTGRKEGIAALATASVRTPVED